MLGKQHCPGRIAVVCVGHPPLGVHFLPQVTVVAWQQGSLYRTVFLLLHKALTQSHMHGHVHAVFQLEFDNFSSVRKLHDITYMYIATLL